MCDIASSRLYPPIINSSVSAIVKEDNIVKIPFTLSRFSQSTANIEQVQVTVQEHGNYQSVVNNNVGIYFSDNIEKSEDYYYIIISGDVLKQGWEIGKIYKIQIRLSEKKYDESEDAFVWLNTYANLFSEWSTFCTVKVIDYPTISIPILDNFIDKQGSNRDINSDVIYTMNTSTIDFKANYTSDGNSNEYLYSYRLKLYDKNKRLIEDSQDLYSNQYNGLSSSMLYVFKTELEENTNYILELSYITVNKYSKTYQFNIASTPAALSPTSMQITTIETNSELKNYTSIAEEEENGRVALKITSDERKPVLKNICIRRSDSKNNFAIWKDFKIINNIGTIQDIPIIYDNTIESGVRYKYGVQFIETNGDRTMLQVLKEPIVRDFEYSYLIGQDGRQLALKYNNTISNYQYNIAESKVDTIGGKYAYITRNGNMNYRTFPLNGLISFQMDENHLFLSDDFLPIDFSSKEGSHLFIKDIDLYGSEENINLHKQHLLEDNKVDSIYDYKREFDFREAVLAFLQDGKPKLFKSATEGNIIVYLMQVIGQPNQSLNRMIYEFSSTAYEVAECTPENYSEFGFWNVGTYSTKETIQTTDKIGQLYIDISKGEDIIKKIYEKYDRSNVNNAGFRFSVEAIKNLNVFIETPASKVINSGGNTVLGHNLKVNNSLITIQDYYVFDSLMDFSNLDSIVYEGPYDNVHIMVNFVYEESQKTYKDKEIIRRAVKTGIGQYHKACQGEVNIFNELYNKYYYETADRAYRLQMLKWTCIEAEPGTVFEIQDSQDNTIETHIIGETGILNFDLVNDSEYITKLIYKGAKDKKVDVIIDYLYRLSDIRYEV